MVMKMIVFLIEMISVFIGLVIGNYLFDKFLPGDDKSGDDVDV